jgi:hypothetical protein
MNPNPEIDIMETVNYSQLSSTLHTWEQTPQGEVHYQRGTNNYNTGYNDISDEADEKENGTYMFIIKKTDTLQYQGCMTIIDEQFDLHYVDIHDGIATYHVDFDA